MTCTMSFLIDLRRTFGLFIPMLGRGKPVIGRCLSRAIKVGALMILFPLSRHRANTHTRIKVRKKPGILHYTLWHTCTHIFWDSTSKFIISNPWIFCIFRGWFPHVHIKNNCMTVEAEKLYKVTTQKRIFAFSFLHFCAVHGCDQEIICKMHNCRDESEKYRIGLTSKASL